MVILDRLKYYSSLEVQSTNNSAQNLMTHVHNNEATFTASAGSMNLLQ